MREMTKKPVYRRFEKILMIDTSDIVPNPLQPRKYFDESELAALAESIKQYGVLQPITVKPCEQSLLCGKKKSENYEIIAGERRWRAAKSLGLAKLPCILLEAERDCAAVLALIENLQRSDLSFFEEATAIYNLLLMTSLSQAELAQRLSLSQSAISNKLRLLRFSENERALICENNLSERQARALLRIESEEKRRAFLLAAINENLSAEALEQMITSQRTKKQPPRKSGVRIGVIRDIGFFFNSLQKSLLLLTDAGINAKIDRDENEDSYEIRVRIQKPHQKNIDTPNLKASSLSDISASAKNPSSS